MLLLPTTSALLLFAFGMSDNKNIAPGTNSPNVSSMTAVYERLAQRLSAIVYSDDGGDSSGNSKGFEQYWVAIAGGAGSGKTTSAENIAERLNKKHGTDCCVVVPMDGFHYSQARLKELHGPSAMLRRGAPWTFDAEGLLQALVTAKKEHHAILPSYSREISDPVPGGVEIRSEHKIVLVEGLYLLHERDPRWAPLGDLWDEKWFVKAPSLDIQKERLVRRSLKTWSGAKARQWGSGIDGATKRAEANDFKNMELIAYCEELADEVIVTS